MNKQKIILFSFLIGLSLIISSAIYIITSNIKEERKKIIQNEKNNTDRIKKDAKEQNTRIDNINLKLGEIKNDIVSFMTTYEDMYLNHKNYISKMEEVEKLLSESYEKTLFLNDKCKTRFSDLEANTLCLNYYINLEELTNIYVSLHKITSNKINEYNEWLKEYTGDKKMESIDFFETKYKEYVDLNKDKVFLGIIED